MIFIFPNTLQLISEFFEKNKKTNLLYGHAQLLDPDDHKIGLCVALPFKINEHLNGVFSIPTAKYFLETKRL